MLIQEIAAEGDDLGAACRVIRTVAAGAVLLRDGIGAVQRVVEASPAGICRIQGVARIVDRNHELRSRYAGNLAVDAFGLYRERLLFAHQIADVGQERPVTLAVE